MAAAEGLYDWEGKENGRSFTADFLSIDSFDTSVGYWVFLLIYMSLIVVDDTY